MAVIVSAILGFLSGLGIGGGSLLILWLTVVLDMAPRDARTINLLFFIPSAVISSVIRWKKGELDLKTPFPAIIAGSLAAVAASWLSTRIATGLLRKIFGLLLLTAGLRELFYRERKAR